MRNPAWWTWLSRFFGALGDSAWPALVVADDTPSCLVVRAGREEIRFYKRPATVVRGGRVVARFEQVRRVLIRRWESDEGESLYRVSLELSWISSVRLGFTQDDVGASIVAAHVGTTLGKKVVVV